jgi:DNA (cytosine-5)-methyltransferase 1
MSGPLRRIDVTWVRHVACADIATVESFPAVDVIVGGPPCQGFSALGRSRGSAADGRNDLWMHYARAIEQSRPRAFVMENVPQLLDSKAWAKFEAHARKLGYNIEARVLTASDYGVAQRRRRAIIIGMRGTRDIPWPAPTHAAQPRTVRQALAGLPLKPDGRNWHIERPSITELSMIRYRHVPPDGGSRDQMIASLRAEGLDSLIPRCWAERASGKGTDVFGRLWWDRPSVTIRTEFHKPEKGRYLHPQEHRPITLREGARLQGSQLPPIPLSFVAVLSV